MSDKTTADGIKTDIAKRGLVNKLAEVLETIDSLEKKGFNSEQNYAFIREADVVEAIRKELAKRRVMLFPQVDSASRDEIGVTAKGSVRHFIRVKMTFTFIDGETGESMSFPWMGDGIDHGDKGIYKAMTGADKYFLLKTFLIPTHDDPESEGAKPSRHKTAVSTTPKSAAGPKDGDSVADAHTNTFTGEVYPACPEGAHYVWRYEYERGFHHGWVTDKRTLREIKTKMDFGEQLKVAYETKKPVIARWNDKTGYLNAIDWWTPLTAPSPKSEVGKIAPKDEWAF